jgi:hypothetical protein
LVNFTRQQNGEEPSRKRQKSKHDKKCNFCGVAGHLATHCWLNPDGVNYRPDVATKMKKALQLGGNVTNS